MRRLILSVFSLCLFFGCANRSGSSSSEIANVVDSIKMNLDSLIFSRVFSPTMQEALNVFDTYFEDYLSNGENFTEIQFYERGEECFFLIGEAPHYFDFAVLGYIKLNNRLYVVNDPRGINELGGIMTLLDNQTTAVMNMPKHNCMDAFISTSELVPFVDTIPGYPKSDGMEHFDPIGVQFKIISPDSIVLIHKGAL